MSGIFLGQVLGNSEPDPGPITLFDIDIVGTDRAEFKLDADGNAYELQTAVTGFTLIGLWINPPTGMNQYEVRATLVDGIPPGVGTFATWLNLGTDRIWGFNSHGVADVSCEISLEVRRVSDAVIVASATITLAVPGF